MDLNSIYFKGLLDRADELEEIRKKIEKAKKEIEDKALSTGEMRDKFESLYLDLLGIQYQSARVFEPMTKFGKMLLKEAKSTQEEYEKLAGPVTTLITEENIDRFSPLISDDIEEDIKTERLKALGALRFKDGDLYPVGVLAFSLRADGLGEQTVLDIEWLYVATDFREQGIATTLLGNIIERCVSLGIDAITIDFPEDAPQTLAFYNMLSDWHFKFESAYAPEFTAKVSKGNLSETIEKLSAVAKPIGGYSKLKELMDDITKGDPGLKKVLSRRHPETYFDPKLSCFVYDKDKNGALLLAHRLPGGLVRCEYLGCTSKGLNYIKGLLSFLAVNARETYGEDTVISALIESAELRTFLDENFKEQLAKPVIEASLLASLSGEDIEIEDAVNILDENAFDDTE